MPPVAKELLFILYGQPFMFQYITLGIGIVETVLDDPDKKEKEDPPPDESIVQQKEKEVPDEME